MMRLRLIGIVAMIAFLTFGETKAQSFAAAYEKAFKFISEADNISYRLTYISLSEEKDTVFKTSMQFERLDDQIYSSMQGVESFVIDSTAVVVDHESETILLNEGQANMPKNEILNRLELIKELEKEAAKVQIDSTTKTVTYRLVFSNQAFNEVAFTVDRLNGRFLKLIFTPKEAVKNYEETEEPPVAQYVIKIDQYKININKPSVPISRYLEQTADGRYQLNKKYSNYQYTNNYGWR